MSMIGINRFQECAAQCTDLYPVEFKYIFSMLPFIDIPSCLLVCKQWHNWISPQYVSRVEKNLGRLESMPSCESTRGKLKILLVTARATACVNREQAKTILCDAKKIAIEWKPETDASHELGFVDSQDMKKGLLSQKQDVIDAIFLILALEASIDRDAAISSLESFKDLIESLSKLDRSYAHFKIAELEVQLGIEGAIEALASSKEVFLKTTKAIRLKIHSTGSNCDNLIRLAWLEAQACLKRAHETLRFATFTRSWPGDKVYERIKYLIVTLKGSECLYPQQQRIFAQLRNSYRQYQEIPALEATDESQKKEMRTLSFLDIKESNAKPVDLAFCLIERARMIASNDSEAAWDILKRVITIVPKIEYSAFFHSTSAAYVVMCLTKETLML